MTSAHRVDHRMTMGARALGAVLAAATAWGLWTTPAPDPVPASLAASLTTPSEDAETGWRLSQVVSHPGVLVIEFPSLAEQGEALNRAAALIEKRGAPRDRVLDDAALDAFIRESGSAPATFYYGHDYTVQQLARLYALAAGQGIALRPAEQRLARLLQRRGLLVRDAQGGWAGTAGAALSTVARVQADDPATPEDDALDPELRAAILRHELSHGVFFVDARYRRACRELWLDDLTEPEREQLRGHFSSLGYDPQDPDLMANELQAFLIHTPSPYGLADAPIAIPPARLTQWRAALIRRYGGRLPLHLP